MSGIDYQISLNNYQTNGNSNFFIFNSGGETKFTLPRDEQDLIAQPQNWQRGGIRCQRERISEDESDKLAILLRAR